MREIRFRAYTDKGEMIYNYCQLIGNRFFGEDMTNTNYGNIIDIMQFTGLHDCEGKEIYEGDIVEIIMPCGTPNEITDTVQYNDVYGCFFLRTRYTSMCDLIQSDYCFKIIGNIHEDNNGLS